MRAHTKTVLALVLLAAAVASCKSRSKSKRNDDGERQLYAQVGANAEALREAFNADAGKVRLIVLVAPT